MPLVKVEILQGKTVPDVLFGMVGEGGDFVDFADQIYPGC